ncbi:6-phosphofructokinase [Anaerobium acetethylicum]|uniref:Pyrophosphate--fructose 6-phosphate 1-phosphotransferase n=1 Tax=Anaerobium acetethylicum TaxID=1619234 RepID=A0A1D3TQ11_9FIRM|nr:6-phosphofructokinase [Anaerobium acetethylicum]SCP95582.1 6-phosphofructokinase 1 [Anaerobium acetethylicum]
MKGNIIVGQSGGPTAVINSSLAGVYKTAKDRGVTKVYGMLNGIQGFLEERYIDLSDYIKNDLDIELLKRTPSAFLGACRYKLPDIHKDKELYEKIFEILNKLDIECFVYIGGNDSMDTIKKLSDYAIVTGQTQRFIGVPKTIDNDLALTDHTPGYGSAAKYIGTATKEVIRDSMGLVYNKGLVTVIEVMGRNAGWLTGATALAKGEDCEGPDFIYLPEVIFDLDNFLEKVGKQLAKKKSVIAAVSEGIKIADGRYVCELSANVEYVDAFGHKQLTGAANYLANRLSEKFGCKTRTVELSTLQRSAAHLSSLVDINEAFQVGGAAVKAADEGDTGKMVVIDRVSDDPYQCSTGIYDVHKISNVEKVVPREWITKDGSNVTEEFLDYVRPLIQGDLAPITVGGIPRHLTMIRHK